MAEKQCIFPGGKVDPRAANSPAVKYGSVIYLGTVSAAVDKDGNVPEGITTQTRMCLDRIRIVAEAAGSCLDKILKVNIYLTDMADYAEINKVYKEYFPENKPARACVQVAGLTGSGKRISMDAIAGE